MRSFLSWWLDQMAGMFAIASAREHSEAVILEIDRNILGLFVRVRGTTTREAEFSADDAGIRQLAQLMAARSDLPRLLLLRLPPEQALRKRLSLPIAARHDLKTALGFEIDRETPFARDEVHWNYTVRGQEACRNRIAIDLAIVPRGLVDPIIDCARGAGLHPSGIEVAMGSEAAAFIPLDAEKNPRWVRSQRSLVPLAASACILAIVAVAIPFIHQQRALASAEATIASLSESVREASALRQSADRLVVLVASLQKARERNGSALTALAAATKSLPDDTYLTAFNLRAGRLTMSGLSTSAAELVGLLARTPAFREPALDSPVVESEREGLERFTISVNVTPEGDS